MREPKSPEQVLWNIFPLLVVAILLLGGIFILPKLNQANLDDRSRASEPTLSPVGAQPDAPAATPEIVCSDLYNPVCDPQTNRTFLNSCEAELAKIKSFVSGPCANQEPRTKNQEPTTPQIPLPSTN